MNTTQLECFMAVSNYLNFSRAAEHLRITQPAVSHQINTLEDELGVKLFYRTSKRVRLTQAGHLFSQYAQEILSLSSMSKARLKESRGYSEEKIRQIFESQLSETEFRAHCSVVIENNGDLQETRRQLEAALCRDTAGFRQRT